MRRDYVSSKSNKKSRKVTNIYSQKNQHKNPSVVLPPNFVDKTSLYSPTNISFTHSIITPFFHSKNRIFITFPRTDFTVPARNSRQKMFSRVVFPSSIFCNKVRNYSNLSFIGQYRRRSLDRVTCK